MISSPANQHVQQKSEGVQAMPEIEPKAISNEEVVLAACKQDQNNSNSTRLKCIKATQQTQEYDEELADTGPDEQVSDTKSITSSNDPRVDSEALEPWQTHVDGQILADELAALLKKHCVLEDHEIDAIVLWVISSYAIDSFRIFPRLALISPEKRCGKTTTLEVIASICKNSLSTSNLTPAAIFRYIDKHMTTLLIDEADTFMNGRDKELTGLINSGHTKSGAKVLRCDGKDFSPKPFNTWAPMLLASIGDLPDTIMDRSVVINLRRKKSYEHVDKLSATLAEDSKHLRQKIKRWCIDNTPNIAACQSTPESVGNDRAADNWLPLHVIAAQINKDWEGRATKAYRSSTSVPELELPTELLKDIKEIFTETKNDKVRSKTLIEKLTSDPEKIWNTLPSSNALTLRSLAKMLRPYGIKSKVLRFSEGGTSRGYVTSDFADAFERYLS